MSNEVKSRNFTLDVIRTIAIFFVISVHFFLKTGYYKMEMDSVVIYISTIFRTVFMICVPLFIILSGYLLNNRKFSIKHYLGIRKVIIIYILCAIFLFAFDCIMGNEQFSIPGFLTNVTHFKWYSWYIKKYIILYMFIPVINYIFRKLESRKIRFSLLCVLFIIVSLSTIFSYFGVSDESPKIILWTIKILSLISDKLYPVLYYYIGVYLHEYKDELRISKKLNCILVVFSFIITGTMIYFKYRGNTFIWEEWNSWNGFIDCINSSFTFMLLLRLDYTRLQKSAFSRGITMFSKISLYIYLLSYIFDSLYYEIFNDIIKNYELKCLLYVIIVSAVFLSSFTLGLLVDGIYKGGEKFLNFLFENYKGRKFLNRG